MRAVLGVLTENRLDEMNLAKGIKNSFSSKNDFSAVHPTPLYSLSAPRRRLAVIPLPPAGLPQIIARDKCSRPGLVRLFIIVREAKSGFATSSYTLLHNHDEVTCKFELTIQILC